MVMGQRFVEAGDGDGGTSQVGHAMLPAPRAHPPMRSFPRTGNAPSPRQGHVISRISANSRSGRSDIRLSPGRESGFRAQTGGPSPRSRNIHPRVRPQRRLRCDVRRLARLDATDDPTPNGSERREESDGSGPSRPSVND